jgi:hypothetical protein
LTRARPRGLALPFHGYLVRIADVRPKVESKWPRGVKGWIAKLLFAALTFVSWWVAFDAALSNFPGSHPHPLLRLSIGVAIVLYVLQL